MSFGSPPPPPQQPNPADVAQTQQQYNLQTGEAAQAGSNVNQVTPFGTLSYQQTGTGPNGVPLYTATTQLSPDQQAILNSLQSQVKTTLGGANYGAQNPADVVGNSTSGLTQDLLNKEVSYLNPFFTQQTNELDTKLRNQGLFPSQSANPSDPNTWGPYEKAMNQARQSQGQTVIGFLAQAEPAAYQQSVSNYMLPLSVSSAEMGLMNPNAVRNSLATTNPLSLQPANYTGAVANANQMAQNIYEDQMKQYSNMQSGLWGIPTAVLGGWAKAGFPGAGAAASGIGDAIGSALIPSVAAMV